MYDFCFGSIGSVGVIGAVGKVHRRRETDFGLGTWDFGKVAALMRREYVWGIKVNRNFKSKGNWEVD